MTELSAAYVTQLPEFREVVEACCIAVLEDLDKGLESGFISLPVKDEARTRYLMFEIEYLVATVTKFMVQIAENLDANAEKPLAEVMKEYKKTHDAVMFDIEAYSHAVYKAVDTDGNRPLLMELLGETEEWVVMQDNLNTWKSARALCEALDVLLPVLAADLASGELEITAEKRNEIITYQEQIGVLRNQFYLENVRPESRAYLELMRDMSADLRRFWDENIMQHIADPPRFEERFSALVMEMFKAKLEERHTGRGVWIDDALNQALDGAEPESPSR